MSKTNQLYDQSVRLNHQPYEDFVRLINTWPNEGAFCHPPFACTQLARYPKEPGYE